MDYNLKKNNNLKLNDESITNNNTKEIRKDLLYFKNDLLKEFKTIESNLNEKYSDSINELKLRLKDYDRKFDKVNQQILDLSNIISNDKIIKDKIDKLSQFKEKTNEKIISTEFKLNQTYNELHNAITKYDKLLSDSVLYPGIIGNLCKFKNFHEFIDYTLQQISQLNSFKDKSLFDLKAYKERLENLIESFKSQIENISISLSQFTTKSVSECEYRIMNELNIYDDKLQDVRLENNKYNIELRKKFDSLVIDWEKVLKIKEEIYIKFDSDVEKYKNDNINIIKKFEEYKTEFKLIKDRFTRLSEFIKDVRFRKNIGKEVKKIEFKKISNQIDFSKKQEFIEQPYDKNNLTYTDENHVIQNFNTGKSIVDEVENMKNMTNYFPQKINSLHQLNENNNKKMILNNKNNDNSSNVNENINNELYENKELNEKLLIKSKSHFEIDLEKADEENKKDYNEEEKENNENESKNFKLNQESINKNVNNSSNNNFIEKNKKKVLEFISPLVNNMSSNKFDVRKKNNLNFFPTLIQSKSHSNMGIKSNEKADKSIKTLKENEKNKNFFLNTVRNENKISNMKKANLKKSNSLFENVFQTTLKENEKKNLTPSLSKDSFFNVDNKNLKHKKTIEINGFKRSKIKFEEKDIKTSLYDYNDLHNVNNGNLSDDLNKKNKKKIKINNKMSSQTQNFINSNFLQNVSEKNKTFSNYNNLPNLLFNVEKQNIITKETKKK